MSKSSIACALNCVVFVSIARVWGRYLDVREVYDSLPRIGNNIFLSWSMLFHNLVCGPHAKDVTSMELTSTYYIGRSPMHCVLCGGPSNREVS